MVHAEENWSYWWLLITQKRKPNHVFPNELKQKATPGKYSQLKRDDSDQDSKSNHWLIGNNRWHHHINILTPWEQSWHNPTLKLNFQNSTLKNSVSSLYVWTWCKGMTHWKRPWCWERLKAGREEDDKEWDGWMASPKQWTWVWVGSGSWWWTGKPGVLQSMGFQRVGHEWVIELTDWCTLFT